MVDSDASAAPEEEESRGCSPQEADDKMDAIVSAINLQLKKINPSYVVIAKTTTTEDCRKVAVSAELQGSMATGSKPYHVVQSVKQSLQYFVNRVGSAGLVSARVQKEDVGCSLRASIAYYPDDQRDKMCWDMLRHGHCPRRQLCRWNHPNPTEVIKLKVVIK
jgi:hypothetical protein